MQKRWIVLLLLTVGAATAETGDAYQRGALAVAGQLARLRTTARVLHIAAHPDDEDSALLAALARGAGARVAYLSLSRGEGGQNSIGPELDEALGVLRTEELLAARRLDGAEQYFAGVYDFGYSKSVSEAAELWDREQTLGEVVSLVRRFRPQVIISRFEGGPADGHGQHQLAALVAREAFRAAADPSRFPDQLALGMQPWQASRLYIGGRLNGDGPARVDVGEISPLYGRSWLDIALEGRAYHRSQDMGRIVPHGPAHSSLVLVDQIGDAGPNTAPLAGLPLDLSEVIPDPGEGGPAWQHKVRSALIEAAELVRQADASYPLGLYPRRTVELLAAALRQFRRAYETVTTPEVPWNPDTATWRLVTRQKVEEAQQALLLAAGVDLQALADRGQVAPGQTLTVAGQLFKRATVEARDVRFRLLAPTGWTVTPLAEAPALGNAAPDAAAAWEVTVPDEAPPSQPYWLREPRTGCRYPAVEPALAGRPFAPPALRIELRALIAGAPVALELPVVQRTADPRRGERWREVEVLPRVSARAAPALLTGAEDLVRVALTNHTDRPLVGTVALRLDGKDLAASAPVSAPAGGSALVAVPWQVPGDWRDRPRTLRCVWREDGRAPVELWQVRTLDYDHVPQRQYLVPTPLIAVALDAKVDTDVRVGIVPGPSDPTPAALTALGLRPRTLDDEALAAGDFGDLELVLVGPRAYEVNPALRSANGRLLEWVAGGGVLVVMYQKYPYVEENYAPYPLQLARPHDRVTDETAPVTLLAPEHPLLARPNRIGEADFAGWHQERGLYFMREWDARYTPLLACADPGEEPQRGGLLVATVGRGAYVYCGYALFRQLPAGVPGAYRLLANLVCYPRRK